MQPISRRQLLTFFGATAASVTLGPTLERAMSPHRGQAEAAWPGPFTPVRLPHPLPIYTTHQSYLATPGGGGQIVPAAGDPSLATYAVADDVVVPPEFDRDVILRWGDGIRPHSPGRRRLHQRSPGGVIVPCRLEGAWSAQGEHP